MARMMMVLMVLGMVFTPYPEAQASKYANEAEFDAEMARLEDGIRRWHPEVIWVDVSNLKSVRVK